MKNTLLSSIAALTAAIAIPSASFAAEDQKAQASPVDAKFAQEASQANHLEVAVAKMAQEKSESAEIKTLAKTIEADHTAAQKKLEPIATKAGIDLQDSMDAKHAEKAEKMEKLAGAEFDKKYAADMVKNHEKDIASFEKAMPKLQNAELKQWAEATLAKLKEHHELAEKAKAASK